jgi:DNA-binding NarL/FixJ family response regulator
VDILLPPWQPVLRKRQRDLFYSDQDYLFFVVSKHIIMKNNNEKKVVLVVDDSLVVLERIIPMLQDSQNVEFVVHAGSYKEALAVLEELKPDCILLDIQLPDQSGIELLQLVREKYDQILVFMMTNTASEHYRTICKQMGANRFFDKSMEFDRIPEALGIAC